MPPEELTKEELKTVKRWYEEKKRELGLGVKPVLSYFGFEGLALRWKRKYDALDVGDFRASIDLLLSFEENMGKERLERLAKREEEFVPEEAFVPEEEVSPVDRLEEEILTISAILKRLQKRIDDLSTTARVGVTPELRDQITALREEMERISAERAENEKLLRTLRKELRELSFYVAGPPVKEEIPIERPPERPPREIELLAGVPAVAVPPVPIEEEWTELRIDPDTLEAFEVQQPFEEKLVALCKDVRLPSPTNICGPTNAEIARDMSPERRRQVFGTTFSELTLEWLHIIPPAKITQHNFDLRTFRDKLLENVNRV